jgi:branched-chain amino acid transport system permease protein
LALNALFSQLLIGLINGSFYALLSLGLAVIFGMLNIINFAHGAFYMIGAFAAYFLMASAGIGYWGALILAPVMVGLAGMATERLLLRRLAKMDHLYGLLMTFGLALVLQGVFQVAFGSSGLPYPIPEALTGGVNLGFMFLPLYRGWVVVFSLLACIATWYLIERTRLGAYLRAATENPSLVRAFGINVPLMITVTYGFGVALAALAGVLSAPINSVRPLMGADLIIVVFAVVVIGGMGSILGSVITGFAVGVVEGLTKYVYPEASSTVIFVLMVLILLVKPTGLTGRGIEATQSAVAPEPAGAQGRERVALVVFGVVVIGLALLPLTSVYPYFIMQILCFALVAGAFNLLIGHGGLLSFGHAMFFGSAGYITAHAVKVWGLPPELGLLAGVATCAGLAALAGAISIRRQGIYFAMITLAISQMLYFVYLRAPFTNGEDGIQSIPKGRMFGVLDLADTTVLYYVVLAGFILGTLAIYRTINSPFGQVLKSIRENEPRAISLGYRTTLYKYVAFILSGTLAGFAGSLKVFVVQNASLTDVHWSMSGEIVLITLLGGLGTLLGPLAGAFVIISSQHHLAEFGQWVTVLQGAIFIACVVAFRRGIVGELAKLLKISL